MLFVRTYSYGSIKNLQKVTATERREGAYLQDREVVMNK